MSLFTTVQATKTPTHLEQIHQVTVTNTGIQLVLGDRAVTKYRVLLDGVEVGDVKHVPADGALVLLAKAFALVASGHSE